MPSFQLSLLTIADARVEKSVASVVFEGRVCDISYRAFEQRQCKHSVGAWGAYHSQADSQLDDLVQENAGAGMITLATY
jgi:hypothetical protein